jgi:hypothetical protein
MKRYTLPQLFAALTLVAMSAFAQAPAPKLYARAEMPLAEVKLYQETCSVGVLIARIEPDYRPLWKNGEALMTDGSGVDKLCWFGLPVSEFGPGYLVISERGVEGFIPADRFTHEVK